MRDNHGRYKDLKEICANGPEGAAGCDKCKFGIVSAPELVGAAVPLYLQRLVHAIDGDIHFCTCQAGKSYRVSLLNRRQEIIERARQDMRVNAKVKIDNPIEVARSAMQIEQAKRAPVPTVHMDNEPTPTPEMVTP
jgi:hypothetical protein